ncbi:uncharacterized protein LOC107045255 [Diachasma alloeum]|uniref:uncharacterized protein LOC107045255 n=1 Tax=Diachasma alloeum TaxID=454923 RepID=UPI000738481F|nr:uncharacterized protein LOC107045255 [Diachasma alloeum]
MIVYVTVISQIKLITSPDVFHVFPLFFYAIPISWACMTEKSEEAYVQVFRYFKTQLAPQIQPTTIHMDFEIGEENAIRRIYPGVTVVHCFFHYIQALFRNLKSKLGQARRNSIYHWGLAQTFVRKLMALALLRAEDIRASYAWLKHNTARDILHFFAPFLEYYENWWLDRVRSERFSVYGKRHRTNNSIEAYHRVLHNHLGDHAGIWKLTANIRNLQAKAHVEVTSLNHGLPIRRQPSRANVIYNTVLRHATRLYSEGSLSIARFLSCANHYLLAFNNELTIGTTEQVEQFITNPAHNIAIHPEPRGIEQIILENNEQNDPDAVWIPIIRTHAREEEISIFILEDLEQSRCGRCGNSILNYISLPCEYWFACQNCTQYAVNQTDRAGLFCPVCGTQCVTFQIMYIS